MERSVRYTWLESEAIAVARAEFRDMFANNAALLIIFGVFYVPTLWNVWMYGAETLGDPWSLMYLIGPVALLALGYAMSIRRARREFFDTAKGTSTVTFEWDGQGLKASGEGWDFSSPWHDYKKVDETDRFIRLHRADGLRPAYVFKRPMSAEQLADFRRCVSIIRPESATFL